MESQTKEPVNGMFGVFMKVNRGYRQGVKSVFMIAVRSEALVISLTHCNYVNIPSSRHGHRRTFPLKPDATRTWRAHVLGLGL